MSFTYSAHKCGISTSWSSISSTARMACENASQSSSSSMEMSPTSSGRKGSGLSGAWNGCTTATHFWWIFWFRAGLALYLSGIPWYSFWPRLEKKWNHNGSKTGTFSGITFVFTATLGTLVSSPSAARLVPPVALPIFVDFPTTATCRISILYCKQGSREDLITRTLRVKLTIQN